VRFGSAAIAVLDLAGSYQAPWCALAVLARRGARRHYLPRGV